MPDLLKKTLRLCYVIAGGERWAPIETQAETAIRLGATMIRYDTGSFSLSDYRRIVSIRDLCKSNGVFLLIDNDPVLSKSLDADGVHLDTMIENAKEARTILGTNALIGATIAPSDQNQGTVLKYVDYVSMKPPLAATLPARKTALALPITALIGMDIARAVRCMENGAVGIVIDSTRHAGRKPDKNTLTLMADAVDCASRPALTPPWQDEFKLISRLIDKKSANRFSSAIRVPPGDDACLLKAIINPVITTDTQREGVHFQFTWQHPKDIGRKAVAVTLSDLAACYADPVAIFINLCLPGGIAEETVMGVYRGIYESLANYGCALGGGNISRGHRFSLDLFAVGDGREDIFPSRAAARPGFGLYATGPLGCARAGLTALQKKDPSFPGLIKRFKAPTARFDAASILARHGVKCVMDISDGLSGDARHMAMASSVSINMDITGHSPEKELVEFCKKYGQSPEDMIIAGGEDYELLFACEPEIFTSIKQRLPEAFQVGKILPYQGKYLEGKAARLSSFQHGQT